MSNFSYDDFAVLVRSFQRDMLKSESLRIVPLSAAHSMADAIHGTLSVALNTADAHLPKQKNGEVVKSNVTVQHDSEGYCRLVGHIEAVKPQEGQEVQDTAVNTAKAFVLYRLKETDNTAEVIAVASLKEGFEIGGGCYPSFTITTVNNYQSVAFNPNAFATVEDLKNINGLDGLHIAFDTASGDLKLLDKDGNVIDQANLPIKADVIIAEGEEGYKYVKTDVKQDIHAAKAWMPEGKTAWEAVPADDYKVKNAALVVDTASRVFVCDKPLFESPVSTKSVSFEHVVIDNSIYMVVDKTDTNCHLRKVKGEAGALHLSAVISGGEVTPSDSTHSYTINSDAVEVDVIEYEGVTCVLVEPEGPGRFQAQPVSGEGAGQHVDAYSGIIVTFGGSTTASRVFVDRQSGTGSYPISTEPVLLEHVVIDNSIYMVVDKTATNCNLIKVKGEAGAQTDISNAGISGVNVTLNEKPYLIKNEPVEVDVIKDKDGVTTYVLAGTDNSNAFRALSIGGNYRVQYFGIIVTSEGSSTGEVLGIALVEQEGTKMYTFGEGVETTITSISKKPVKWFGKKDIPAGTSLKYGLEAFVWTVKDAKAGDKIINPFFKQLNASLLALGFHEGDDIALGTNLPILAQTGEDAPLNRVDADEYMHGKKNKATREQEVDDQRKLAQDELVAWNAQHPALVHDGFSGTRISSDGVDIRNGKILIGNGNSLGNDAVKHYELSTNFSSDSAYPPDQGLAFSAVTDASTGNLVNSNVLTISRYGYISGAPICMAMAAITESEGAIGFALLRRTSCFGCNIEEANGNVTITIKDNRLNSAGFSGECIVEISPVYISAPAETSETSAHETLPALNMVNTVAKSEPSNPTQLTCTCPQIMDWANSVNISSGARMFVIVKVY